MAAIRSAELQNARRSPASMILFRRGVLAIAMGAALAPGAEGAFDGNWSAITTLGANPVPRRDMGVIYDAPRDRLVALGGLGETWTLALANPTSWVRLPIQPFPTSATDHAVYDAVGDRMVVVTSNMQVFALDLGSPTGWQSVSTSGTPPPGRRFYASAHDAARNRFLIFGGGPDVILGDLWALTLNGTPTWTQISPSGSAPLPSWGAVAAFDPVGDRLIVGMGSVDLTYTVNSSLYSVNLTGPPAWSPLTVQGSPPIGRMLSAFTYDPGLQRIVMFSGYPTEDNDTWSLELVGTPTWVMLQPTGTRPPYQWSSAMVYRSADPSLWLYGGHSGADFYGLWRLTSTSVTQAPIIGAITPPSGEVGDPVTIFGVALGGASDVQFNGVSAVIQSYAADRIETTVPAGATSGPISVTTPNGTGVSSFPFLVGLRAVMTSLDPDSGRVGDVITIHGANFTGATAVRLGGTGSAAFSIVDDGTLTATVDSSASTGPVHVINPYGTGIGPAVFIRLADEPRPRLLGVRDVRGDQGGKVIVGWRASDFDQPRHRVITGYRVWRRAPQESATGSLAASAPLGTLARWAPSAGEPEVFWESLVELPAAYLRGYAYAAATLRDSTADGNPYTAFFVQALTADPFVFYNSSPDSGYSVDDLAPPAPAPLTVIYGRTANEMHWRGRAVPDLHGYRLHRGSEPLFLPLAENLIATTTDTTYVDIPGSHFYKLAAVDIHGNLSRYVAVSPDRPVATLASFYQAFRTQGLTRVIWYSGGNAGLLANVYRRTVNSDWEPAGTVSADGTGFLTFEDRTGEDGLRYGYRLGIVEGGEAELFLGEAWVEPLATAFAFAGRVPNPSPGGRIACSLSVPANVAAELKLFDVSGRVVERHSLDSSTSGERSVVFGSTSRLRAGVYMIQATSRDRVMTKRVVVLD